jgi:hypothetical protein
VDTAATKACGFIPGIGIQGFLCVDDLAASVHHPHPIRGVGVANRKIVAGLQTIRDAAVVAPVAPPVPEIADVSSRVNSGVVASGFFSRSSTSASSAYFGALVGVRNSPKRLSLRRWRLWVQIRQIELLQVGMTWRSPPLS